MTNLFGFLACVVLVLTSVTPMAADAQSPRDSVVMSDTLALVRTALAQFATRDRRVDAALVRRSHWDEQLWAAGIRTVPASGAASRTPAQQLSVDRVVIQQDSVASVYLGVRTSSSECWREVRLGLQVDEGRWDLRLVHQPGCEELPRAPASAMAGCPATSGGAVTMAPSHLHLCLGSTTLAEVRQYPGVRQSLGMAIQVVDSGVSFVLGFRPTDAASALHEAHVTRPVTTGMNADAIMATLLTRFGSPSSWTPCIDDVEGLQLDPCHRSELSNAAGHRVVTTVGMYIVPALRGHPSRRVVLLRRAIR